MWSLKEWKLLICRINQNCETVRSWIVNCETFLWTDQIPCRFWEDEGQEADSGGWSWDDADQAEHCHPEQCGVPQSPRPAQRDGAETSGPGGQR